MKRGELREKEAGSIDLSRVQSSRRVQIVAPTVTRRPTLDVSLGYAALVAEAELRAMADKVSEGTRLDKDERKNFTEIAQQLVRQARAEMEIEKHVDERDKKFKDKEIAMDLAEALDDALKECDIEEGREFIINKCLEAVGLEL